MILEAYVLIAPERVIPVSVNLYESNQIIVLINYTFKRFFGILFYFLYLCLYFLVLALINYFINLSSLIIICC